MATVATDLEWGYAPADLFEEPFMLVLDSGTLTIDNERARLRLTTPSDPLTPDVQEAAHSQVTAVFDAQLLLLDRAYTLRGPDLIQLDHDGKRHISVVSEGLQVTAKLGAMDVMVTNRDGKVVTDTRAERLRNHEAFVSDLAPRAARSPLLTSLARSYAAALLDPADALVHLYEIRDALSTSFGGEESARSALGITSTDWRQLGQLANDEPLQEGRHRGRHATRTRPATPTELVSARDIARRLILRFAQTVT